MSRSETPYSPEATLTTAQERNAATYPERPRAGMDEPPLAQYRVHPAARWFRRGPWENFAVGLIGLGIVMLMQPYSMTLYTWSFLTILAGTALFVIVSHFPD